MKKYTLLLFNSLLLMGMLNAQPLPPEPPVRYDSDLLSADFHKSRRAALLEQLPANALAVFFSAPIRNRQNDVDFMYRQDSNLYYLTGTPEAESILILAPSGIQVGSKNVKEVLFNIPRDKRMETWTGRRMGSQRVMDELGIELAVDHSQFETVFNNAVSSAKYHLFHLPFPSGVSEDDVLAQQIRVVKNAMEHHANLAPNQDLLFGTLAEMRQTKTPEEQVLLQKSIGISCAAHKEAMRSATDGMTEYELEGVIDFVYKRNGSEFAGYPHIIGSNENSTVLHYNTNRRKFNDGELILVDSGAEYHGYTADITRTFPVNGVFSAEQRAVYEVVLAAQKAAEDAVKIGASMNATSIAAREVLANGLVKLGIIQRPSQANRFTLHGVSHGIGLDVHDIGGYASAFRVGNMFTIEPGIYITPANDVDPKWWNIGIRVEDDYIITANGLERISTCVPREIDEIEALMQETGIGNLPNGKL